MNVSEQLLRILKNEHVKHIFGVAGDALNPLVSALANQDDIQWIKMKHEGNASFAAFAQGELGENLGVCASTVGPGALHLVNGLYNAKKERSPVLAITGQVPTEKIGTSYHQEVDLAKVFDDICEYQAVIRSPKEAPKVILRAIRIALNNKCVCRVELPADIAHMEAEDSEFILPVYRSDSIITPSEEQLKKATQLINNASKVGILAGAGCRGAKDEVIELSKLLKAPLTHTVRASDIFDHHTENVVGLTGLIGNPSGYDAIMECDLLLMLGTDFPYSNYLPETTQTIQVDIRPENIGNRTPVTLGIHGDLKYVVRHLIKSCTTKEESEWVHHLNKEFTSWLDDNCRTSTVNGNMKIVHPQMLAREISDIASDNAIFVVDTGTSAIWASNFMDFHSHRRMIGSFNHGSMAVGLPAAIGAQLQYPEREVWALIGDGAFNMTLHDFSTAVEYELPIKLVVLNNNELGFVKIEMEEAGLAPNYDALAVKNFDFAEFANLVGGEGISVNAVDEIAPAIESAKKSKKPFIISANVTSGELSMPSHVDVGMASNFAMSKIKELIKATKGDNRNWENVKSQLMSFMDKEL